MSGSSRSSGGAFGSRSTYRNRVVAGVADRAADKRRQIGGVDRRKLAHQIPQRLERILAGRRLTAIAADDRNFVAAGLEPQKRAPGDEAVASNFLAADDALEETRRDAVVEATERRNGREGVRHQPPRHGNQTPRGRRGAKLIERRKTGHRACRLGGRSRGAVRIRRPVQYDRGGERAGWSIAFDSSSRASIRERGRLTERQAFLEFPP